MLIISVLCTVLVFGAIEVLAMFYAPCTSSGEWQSVTGWTISGGKCFRTTTVQGSADMITAPIDMRESDVINASFRYQNSALCRSGFQVTATMILMTRPNSTASWTSLCNVAITNSANPIEQTKYCTGIESMSTYTNETQFAIRCSCNPFLCSSFTCQCRTDNVNVTGFSDTCKYHVPNDTFNCTDCVGFTSGVPSTVDLDGKNITFYGTGTFINKKTFKNYDYVFVEDCQLDTLSVGGFG